MAVLAGKFKSVRQDWATPASVFEPLQREFRFTLDAAADLSNAKAAKFFTEQDDGLAQPWGDHVVWINPPYGDGAAPIRAWVAKAYQESLLGATCVLLLPARTNTNWFHDLCLARGEVRFIKGRPKFGGAAHGLPQPLCVVIFRAEAARLDPQKGGR